MKTPLRRVFISVLAGALLLAGVFALSHYFSEPRHGGQRLTFWLKEYYERSSPRSEKAILAIGTNAIPTLMKMLLEERSFFLSSLVEKLPIEFVRDDSAWMQRRNLATVGFRVLGSNAVSAVPALLPLLEDRSRSYLAAEALQYIGEPALMPVEAYLTSTNANTKRYAVHLILAITDHAPAKVQSLLDHPDPVVRGHTYLYLRRPGVSTDYVLDELFKGLRDPDPSAASYAAIAIRTMGDDGTNALPRLYELQNSTNTLAQTELATTIKNLEKRIRLSSVPHPISRVTSP